MIARCLKCNSEYKIDESLDCYERLNCTRCNIAENKEMMNLTTAVKPHRGYSTNPSKRNGSKIKDAIKKRCQKKRDGITERIGYYDWVPEHF